MNPDSTNILASVDRYDIRENTWSKSPPLRKPRSCHSSCTLNDRIFVFCGIAMNFTEFKREIDNSIEFFNARAHVNGLHAQWETILVPEDSAWDLSCRIAPLVSPLNSTQIAILGGSQDTNGTVPLGDVHIFDTETISVQEEITTDYKFHAYGNLSVTTAPNQIEILVMDVSEKFHLVSVT